MTTGIMTVQQTEIKRARSDGMVNSACASVRLKMITKAAITLATAMVTKYA